MNKILLTAASLVAMSTFAMAQDNPTNKEEKAAQELTKGPAGPKGNPTAMPETGGKQDAESKDLTKGGTTANPTAQPETGGKHP